MERETTLTDVHELVLYVVQNMPTKEDIAAIREEMDEGFAVTATKKELRDGFAAIREEMATKTEMSAGFASIRSEISEAKQQVKDLEETVRDHSNFAKEIDHNLARIATIERHLELQAS